MLFRYCVSSCRDFCSSTVARGYYRLEITGTKGVVKGNQRGVCVVFFPISLSDSGVPFFGVVRVYVCGWCVCAVCCVLVLPVRMVLHFLTLMLHE